MHVREKILLDKEGLLQHGPINIVIFGDSVSHGAIDGYLDYENVYWNLLKQRLNAFRDYMPVNMINASIGATTAKDGLSRLERDVLSHHPDLVIVCFGLNDVTRELEDYLYALEETFSRCQAQGCDVIFMTPNMLNTYVTDDIAPNRVNYANKTANIQNSGRMDQFMDAAVALANRMGITVCNCYAQWKELAKTQDTTMLLANRINHPISPMHKLFADSLYQIIMGSQDASEATQESTMICDH